jgi:hypothetical protein
VDNQTIGSSLKLSGSLFGSSDAKYVLGGDNCGQRVAYVINSKGEVWMHLIDSQSVGDGKKLNGPSLFGGSDHKYAVYIDGSILVINTRGEVWSHNVLASTRAPQTFCDLYDTIRDGHKLAGTSLFGGPNDRYVLALGHRLLVVNTLGEVWAHDLSSVGVGAGVKLSGPGLFGTPNDTKYVVAYDYTPPPRIN